ncbi:MAG TPA: efflux RND transporter periplasmic adaptor subunit [Lentimicrobium sp.]|nr:efflux RND transporter periplasmic adaptor subunit [Lentimicrobium sp.]
MSKTLKRILTYVFIIVVLFVIVGYKAGIFEKKENNEASKGKSDSAEILPVSGYIVAQGGLTDRIVATGNVMANEEVQLSAEVAGRITAINFTEGTNVIKGTVLVTINDTELLAQLEKVHYNQKLAKEREQRAKSLLQKEAISQEEYDRALTDLNTVNAEASLIQAQLEKSKIIAPFSGTIGLRQVSEGAFVTPGQRIATLTQVQPVKIEFSVPERFAQSVSKNSKVTFSMEGSNNKFEAVIYAVEPFIDQETRTVSVRAFYPNRNLELRPGSFARVEFELNHMENALQIPAQAVIPELGGYRVFKYENGKAEQKKIGVGIRTSEMVQVTEGLENGDTIITSGLLQLRSGMPVNISNISR